MTHSIKPSVPTEPKSFTDWLQTHEMPCRQMVRRTCLRRVDILHSVALEPDDVFGDVCLKLLRKNPTVPSVGALMSLVSTCALNHLRDKGRKNRTRQSIFEALVESDESAQEDERLEYDPAHSPTPDHQLSGAESLALMHQAALSDSDTACVFHAIRELEAEGVATSISNLSRYLGKPYAAVRRSRLRLQENVRRGL